MKFPKSFDRKINRNDNSSPYRRSSSPKSGPQSPQHSAEKHWSVSGFFKFLKNITASIASNDRENDLPRYRNDSYITPSTSGSSAAAVEVLLNNENRSQTQAQNRHQNRTTTANPIPQTQAQVHTDASEPQQEVTSATPDPTPSTTPPVAVPVSRNASDRILHWARMKVLEGNPLNDLEVIGLRKFLNERQAQQQQQNAEYYEPEKLSLATEEAASSSRRTPTFSLNTTLPTFTSHEPVRDQRQRKGKMLKRDPNGPLYWRGAGRARVRPTGASYSPNLHQLQATKVEFSKRRRVADEGLLAATSSSMASASSSSTSVAPAALSTEASGSGLLNRLSGMPLPERVSRPTVVRPRTAPSVSSPLRNSVVNGGSPPHTDSTPVSTTISNGRGIASKGFAVNLMAEVIKNNTPEKKPAVANPYQAATPVKLGTQTSTRTKLAGKRRLRETSVENVTGASDEKKKEKEKDRVLSAKDIIEATVPRGAKRTRPTASDLRKPRVNGETVESAFAPSSGFSIGGKSPFGQVFQEPVIEEPEDEEGGPVKRQKKAKTTATVEDAEDDGPIISFSASSSNLRKTTKTSSVLFPSEIIEPKENSSPAWSNSRSAATSNNVNINGNNNLKTTNGSVLGKTLNLPREPSKLRKSFVAEDENENENVELRRNEKRKGVSSSSFSIPTIPTFAATTVNMATGKTSTFGTSFSPFDVSSKASTKTSAVFNMTPQSKPLGIIQEKGDVRNYVRQLSLMDLPRFVFCRPDPGCVAFPGKTDLGRGEMDELMINIMELPENKMPGFDLNKKASVVSSRTNVNGFVPTANKSSGFAATAKPAANGSAPASSPAPSVGFNWAKAGMKPPTDPTKEGKWVCGECTLTNDDTKAVKCAYCDARRPEPKATSSTSSSSLATRPTVAPSTGFNWAKAGMKPPTDPAKEGKWVCGECTLTNDNTKAIKCAYCDSRRSEPEATRSSSTGSTIPAPSTGFDWAKAGMKPPTDPTKEGKWVCGECTLTNDNTKAVKCAYCDAQKPGSTANTSSTSTSVPTSIGFDWAKAGMKPPSDPTKEGKWVCGECTLVNDDTKAVKCAYCDSRR